MSELFYDQNGQPKAIFLPYEDYVDLLDALEFQTNTAEKYRRQFEEVHAALEKELTRSKISSGGFILNDNDRYFRSARGRYLDSTRFLVYKGSKVKKYVTASFLRDSHKMCFRNQLIAEGILVDDKGGSHYVFSQDCEFPSPSLAASIVVGNSKSGNEAWGKPDK